MIFIASVFTEQPILTKQDESKINTPVMR